MIRKNNVRASWKNIKIHDNFWSRYQTMMCDEVIPYQEKIMEDAIEGVEKSHVFENFRIAAGESEGEFYGFVFQDSDLAKWLEAVSYSLAIKPDAMLEARADEIIALIGRAQEADGYLNTYFTINTQYGKFENLREAHELYCSGHMLEAAAAYYEATGKDRLLKIMEKNIALIYDRFITQKHRGYCGHQEIELALLKLYRVTGNEKYLKLSKHFIDERGREPNYFSEEEERINWVVWGKFNGNHWYYQAHKPVREQDKAVGHAVRAVYMYTAMADLAAETDDSGLYNACLALWDNIVHKQMYITGAIGSTVDGEAFSADYELPGDSIYGETCASIGLVFFAQRMLEINPSNTYADILEQALYNCVLSSMSLNGKRFFYCNPLEVNPGISGEFGAYKHIRPERPQWHACACCPPNLARFITSLGEYAWSEGVNGEKCVYSHLYIGGTAGFKAGTVEIALETSYPWDGDIRYTFTKANDRFAFAFRIPAWAKTVTVTLNGEQYNHTDSLRDGYCYISRKWESGDSVTLSFALPVRRIYTNAHVRANIGKVAIMRGPLVYCAEGIDNLGGGLQSLVIPRDTEIKQGGYDKDLLEGVVPLYINGLRLETDDSLYSETPPHVTAANITLIPYYAWGNRGLSQMRVWFEEGKEMV
jgi:DUF1680 family protein